VPDVIARVGGAVRGQLAAIWTDLARIADDPGDEPGPTEEAATARLRQLEWDRGFVARYLTPHENPAHRIKRLMKRVFDIAEHEFWADRVPSAKYRRPSMT
jgi:hypothetical protein